MSEEIALEGQGQELTEKTEKRREREHKEDYGHKHKEEKFDLKVWIKDSISIIIGVLFAVVGLEFFIVPNHLLDGGVTGISLLIAGITKLDVSILIFTVLIFAVAAVLNGIETAMYSILVFMAASKTIEFLTNGLEEYTGVTIISEKS